MTSAIELKETPLAFGRKAQAIQSARAELSALFIKTLDGEIPPPLFVTHIEKAIPLFCPEIHESKKLMNVCLFSLATFKIWDVVLSILHIPRPITPTLGNLIFTLAMAIEDHRKDVAHFILQTYSDLLRDSDKIKIRSFLDYEGPKPFVYLEKAMEETKEDVLDP